MFHCTKKAFKPLTRTSNHLLILFLSASVVCQAEVYKWTDQQGNTHYSDIKPNNTNTEKLRIQTQKNISNRKSPQTSANELQQRKAKELEAKSEQLKASTEKRELDAKCEAIRSNLKTIEENSRIKINENNEARFLTPEEITSRKQKYNQQLKEHCS